MVRLNHNNCTNSMKVSQIGTWPTRPCPTALRYICLYLFIPNRLTHRADFWHTGLFGAYDVIVSVDFGSVECGHCLFEVEKAWSK